MPEKLFIIMEVVDVDEGKVKDGINHHYKPIEAKFDGFCDEELWLQPERVIPARRLRYGKVDEGQKYFTRSGWVEVSKQLFVQLPSLEQYLILDPPAPVDEWEKWVEEMPVSKGPHDYPGSDDFKAWFRRMPRRNP